MSSRDADSGLVDRLPWDLAPSGLVLTGKPDFGLLDRLRRAHPDLVIAYEPDADTSHVATAADSFLLPPDDLFGEVTLGRFLDEQKEAGASFCVTPTGHLRAGDSDAAKAVIDAANELNRDDVVVRLPCEPAFLRTSADQLVAIARRSRHPVALSLSDDQDPMARRGAVSGIRTLTAAVPTLGLWRTDLAAFAHLAEGGLTALVGFVPSLRHGLSPGKRGRRNNLADNTPHVLLPQLFRYMRASELQRRYASTEPPHCTSTPCRGAALDRFTGSTGDRLAAHEHNAVALLEIAAELHRFDDPADRVGWWATRLRRAIEAHDEAERQTSQHWPLPPVLAAWAKRQGIAAA